MEPQAVERRLTTILSADVVGYSRLMGEDEAATLAALKAHRKELLEPKAAQYHGRTVKLMGDGALMEFGSVVDAVLFAIEVQCAMRERNASVPEERRIVYRVGINIGDIIVEGEDIYGDGVNVAARLQELPEAGGISLARNVFNQVKDKLDLSFECLGEKAVKNIREPITVYRVALDDKAAALVTPVVLGVAKARQRSGLVAAAAVLVLVVIVGGALWWQPWAPDVEPASIGHMAYPLPDKPSIAVLPFDNMSGDPNQDYFADGLTDDLITDLSNVAGLFVIARNSTFAYKGQTVSIRQVAEELGVRYVLEGSVRRSGDQIRINTQLIDATTGGHVWAERYDKALTEIFELQDQVTAMVVSALEVHLTAGEIERRARRDTDSPEAYDAWLRGKEHGYAYTKEDYVSAIAHFRKAVEIDPEYATAYAWLAGAYLDLWSNEWESILELSSKEVLAKAKLHLEEAMKINPSIPGVYHLRSRMLSDEKRFDEAIAEAEKMLALSPNSVDGLVTLGRALIKAGRFDEGLEIVKKAARLDPKGSEYGWYHYRIGEAQYHAEQYSEAAESFKAYTERYPNEEWGYLYLAATYGQMGHLDEARNALDTFEDIRSRSDHEPYILADINNWTFKYDADRERLREGLRRAGVPE